MVKNPKIQEIIDLNKKIIEKIKVKKADQAKVLSIDKLQNVTNECKKIKGDVYDKAVCLIKGISKNHPFASGNRRTAFAISKKIIEDENKKFNVENSGKQAKTLQGIREDFYDDKEIKEWFKTGKIRKFKRF